MNNNQNVFNTNPQSNNQNTQNQNRINENNGHQFDDAFMNRLSNNTQINDNIQLSQDNFINQDKDNSIFTSSKNDVSNKDDEINPILTNQTNKFINNNVDTNNTSLDSLNIVSDNTDLPKVDYSKDPKVIENLNNITNNKKNTVTITSEGKVFIIIIIVLLLFIFAMPTIFDYIEKIKYQ